MKWGVTVSSILEKPSILLGSMMRVVGSEAQQPEIDMVLYNSRRNRMKPEPERQAAGKREACNLYQRETWPGASPGVGSAPNPEKPTRTPPGSERLNERAHMAAREREEAAQPKNVAGILWLP